MKGYSVSSLVIGLNSFEAAWYIEILYRESAKMMSDDVFIERNCRQLHQQAAGTRL